MKKITLILLGFTLLVGCSSTLSEGSIRKATAKSLGLQEHEFTFGNREDNPTEIKYDVKTKKGERYKCTMTYVGTYTTPTCLDKNGQQVKPIVKKEVF